MEYFYGIVEDRHDPLMIGRVRVRVHGVHTDDKNSIATPDLPWAQVIMSPSASGLSGIGMNSHGLVEGSTVFGFWRDSTKQDPIVLGVSTGITVDGYKEDIDGNILSRLTSKGFNDPRLFTVSDYDGTADGPNPAASSNRGWGLSSALDTAPKQPSQKGRIVNYDGSGSTVDHAVKVEGGQGYFINGDEKTAMDKERDLPYYPLNYDESDISKFARGEGDYSVRSINDIKGMEHYPNSPADPKYPYNHVWHSESGHILEIDDTFEAERLAIEHRSGTFMEIHPDGSEVHHIVNDHYHVVCKDHEVYVGGKVNVRILGNASIHANGNVEVSAYGSGLIDVSENMEIKSGQNIKLQAAQNIELSATNVKF